MNMIFNYPKTNKVTEVLSDLVKINNDRVILYQKALEQSANIDSYVQDVFANIIADGINFRQQLAEKIKQFHGEVKNNATLFGKIYATWIDLKVTFICHSQKTMIASYLYNEEVTLQVYRAALSMSTDMDNELYQLIEKQKNELKENYTTVKNYRKACQSIDYSLLQFT